MRILLINKFYYLSGGAERYLFEQERILRAHGHEVMAFSMRHPLNRPCAEDGFFADEVRFQTDLPLRERLRAAAGSVWNANARRKLDALLRERGAPDIAHVHAFVYQLTPSVLLPLWERGIPTVQTCHEYAHVCVNQRLYDQRRNRICDACLKCGRLAPLWTRCIKGSFAASATGCLAGLVDLAFGRSRKRVQRFLTPSDFMRNKLIQGGMPADRVFHVPNFIDVEDIQASEQEGDFILFLGRLVPQKGVLTFLDAARRAPHIPCKLVGGGDLEAEARDRVTRHGLTNVEVLGHREDEELWSLVARARAVVVPSEWYEPFCLVILEAMARARSVIASRIAGPAEIVSHGRDGLLVPPSDAEGLAAAFETLWGDATMARDMGRRGREKVESIYNAERHYETLMRHYEELVH